MKQLQHPRGAAAEGDIFEIDIFFLFLSFSVSLGIDE